MKLRIAENLSLPTEIVTQTVAVLAKRRAGKSYLMRRLVEQLVHASQQVVLVDPKGDQWGVRSAADGKAPGLPLIILGGERGDVPLEAGSGEVVAKLVVEERVSVVLDLSLFRKHEVATFMTAFMENLYRLKAKEIYRTPLMLVMDEADAVAPQKPQKGEERMLGAAEDIVRRGGQRGIGCVFLTQRSAVLNKNVLTQAQVLIALRTIAPQDLAAMNAWIDVHGTEEQKRTLMESLPSLPIGDAWVWSPGWPTVEGIFKRVHVLPIETFDSGASPDPNDKKKRAEPKAVAAVDLEALKRQMSATIEKAKAEDPRELKKTIAEKDKRLKDLQAQLEKAVNNITTKLQTKVIEKPVLTDAQIVALDKAIGRFEAATDRAAHAFTKPLSAVIVMLGKLSEAVQSVRQPALPLPPSAAAPTPPRRVAPHVARPPVPPQGGNNGDGERLAPGERKILTAVAQFGEVDRGQLTVLVGYKATARDTYISRLAQKGFVESGQGRVRVLQAGVDALGADYEPLPTGAALLAFWRGRLPSGECKVLDAVVATYPESISRHDLGDRTEYKATARDTYVSRLASRRLVKSDGRGSVRASEELFS